MILGAINNSSRYYSLSDRVKLALKYLAEHENELENLPAGKYEIDGDKVNFTVTEFEAAKPEEKFFETHDEHIDIHVTVKGTEWYGYVPAEKMTSEKDHSVEKDNRHFYDKCEDGLFFKAMPGHFLIFMPEDAHKAVFSMTEQGPVKKIVMKIKI
ncbi:MAG: YhcH/YjgK/YiaL family protein [Synergistaceae bacterium]|nr:YhcH/YjgK/YiaL family protein [Synergistaceae bacterium]